MVEGFFAKKSRSTTEAPPVEHSKIRTRLKAQLARFSLDPWCLPAGMCRQETPSAGDSNISLLAVAKTLTANCLSLKAACEQCDLN